MAVPKRKTSPSKRGMRRAGQHHKLFSKNVMIEPETGEYTLPHRIAPSGRYKGIQYFELRDRSKKDDEKEKEDDTTS